MSNLKKGFTLAETLITLVVIGVLMAIMLRAINRVNPDKDKIMFIKTYHAVETVVADVISDPTFYDQSMTTERDRQEFVNNGGIASDLHMDFRDAPFATAEVSYNGVTMNQLNQKWAPCYILADRLNILGDAKCGEQGGSWKFNFKTTGGVCFYGVGDDGADGNFDFLVSPSCIDDADHRYAIRVYKDGRMTVPSSHDQSNVQSKAYDWMSSQDKLN